MDMEKVKKLVANLTIKLKQYIHMNTKLRQKAKNNFEKDFFKLMNNAIKNNAVKNLHAVFDGRERVFESGIFRKTIEVTGFSDFAISEIRSLTILISKY